MKLEELSKEQLLEEIKKLKRRKKYGLVWEDKPESVVERCKKEIPVLEESKGREIEKKKDAPYNLIIEGDNYHSLSVLNYTHAGK
ncbi:site-specific DNA-methyltransferase, partial [Candidatus Dojkabacteria bacterium]|nr:site-specific DNA-methyltransferase [Candidatus Dojkabacteria bacterium]